EEGDQQYVLFPMWSSSSINPQNNNGDDAFVEKEPEFDAKKPESEVNVSPSKFKDYSEDSTNEVNAVGTLVPAVGQNSLNSTNTFSAAGNTFSAAGNTFSAAGNTFSADGPSNVAASPTHGKSSSIDASQLPDDPDMPELEDITYSDDEDDVGAEADFNNLETSITVSPIPTTAVHKNHHVTQIIGDLSSATQTRSMARVAKDQGFEDPDHLDKVYKVVKALYGLHQAPRAWYETLANYLLENGFQRGKIDQTLFIKRQKCDILLVQIYVDDIIFDTEKPLLKDPDGEDVDVHTYRSMIGSLMYLTSSRPDIMFAKCKKQTVMATSSIEAEYVAVASCCAQVNDVIRLEALVDKKKVVVTEATIRQALRLDDAKGVECLPNEEIFAELARMGYEKPSTKLTSSMASAVICLSSGRKFNFSKQQVGDLLTHTTKYTSPALTQKVFANIRRVGKGFSRVETPLFKGMLVEQQVDEEGDADENDENVNVGDGAEGDVSAAHGEVPTLDEEPSIPSLTPPTLPQQPSQYIPLNSQLKIRVKKLERRNKVKVLKLKRLQKVGTSQRVETSDETMMDDVSNQGRMIAKMDQDADVVLEDKEVVDEAKKAAEDAKVVDVVTTAKIITEVVTAASETITDAEAQVPAVTLTAAPARVTVAPSRRRKGVVTKDPEEESTTSTIIPAKTKSNDKGKGILVEEPKPLK
nr:putative ribonuclease H-like domain-containing protein [Tanacetum cinerariifolium]